MSRLSLAMILALLLFSCQALAQTSPIAPNGIEYVGDADTFSSGQTYTITLAILYNGGQLKSEGVRVYLLSSDTSVIPAELGTYVLTDKNGVANYTITANKTGDVTLTATAMSVSSGVSAVRKLHVIQGAVATPTAVPSATTQATQVPTTSPTANPTAVPTAQPTAVPTAQPTAAPTNPPAPSGSAEQAIGIIVAGIALALVLLAAVIIAKSMGKK